MHRYYVQFLCEVDYSCLRGYVISILLYKDNTQSQIEIASISEVPNLDWTLAYYMHVNMQTDNCWPTSSGRSTIFFVQFRHRFDGHIFDIAQKYCKWLTNGRQYHSFQYYTKNLTSPTREISPSRSILHEERTHNIARENPPREEEPRKPRESRQEEHRPRIFPPVHSSNIRKIRLVVQKDKKTGI